MGAFSYLKFSIEDFLWQSFIRHSGLTILTVPISEEYVYSASLPFQDFCVWNPVLPLDLQKYSKTACMELVQSFGMPLVNCPSFACV